MKRIIAALILAASATAVYAACSSQTYIKPSGEIVTCSTCCNGNNNCTTICF